MQIEVTNPIIQTRTINSAKGEFQLCQLEAWAMLSKDGYPEKVLLNVNPSDQFQVGIYDLSDSSFYVGSFNKLELGKAVLTKAK